MIKKIKYNCLFAPLTFFAVAFTVSCLRMDLDDPGGKSRNPMSDDSLSLRQIAGKYYANIGFYLGGYLDRAILKSIDNDRKQEAQRYYSEFPLMYCGDDFNQSSASPTYNPRVWNADSYNSVTVLARNHNQKIRAVCSIGPYCSPWAKEDDRSSEELEQLLDYYVANISKAMTANSDVVYMADMIEDCISPGGISGTGYEGLEADDIIPYDLADWLGPRTGDDTFENPWTMLGMKTVTLNGDTFEFPTYIYRTFEVANANAPNLKKYISQLDPDLNYAVWEKMKNLVIALRSLGQRVDGICWKALLPLGWEKNVTHTQDLKKLVEWCYLNNVEFHMAELGVLVSDGTTYYDMDKVIATYDDQTATFNAVADIILAKAGHGAMSMSFTNINGYFANGKTCAGLFEHYSFEKTPVYHGIHSAMLLNGKK